MQKCICNAEQKMNHFSISTKRSEVGGGWQAHSQTLIHVVGVVEDVGGRVKRPPNAVPDEHLRHAEPIRLGAFLNDTADLLVRHTRLADGDRDEWEALGGRVRAPSQHGRFGSDCPSYFETISGWENFRFCGPSKKPSTDTGQNCWKIPQFSL